VIQANCSCAGTATQVVGCTSPNACNYNPLATADNNTCYFPGALCDDGNPNTTNDMIQADCSCLGGATVVLGCTDQTACNYQPAANAENGSCFYPGTPCDDGNPNTTGDVLLANCACQGTAISSCPTVTPGSGLVAVCSGGSANVAATVSGTGSFSVVYALHTTPNYLPATTIATSNNGSFSNPGGSNVTYYVTVLVGRDTNGDGIPDPGSECYNVYTGQQVVFLAPVVINVSSEGCDEGTGVTTISWVISGGLPGFNSSASYSVTGAVNGQTSY